MSDYTMAQAKRDFERGFLVGAVLRHEAHFIDKEGGGWDEAWFIALELTAGFEGMLVDARAREARPFRTLDAACKALKQIGFMASRLRVMA